VLPKTLLNVDRFFKILSLTDTKFEIVILKSTHLKDIATPPSEMILSEN